MGISKAADYSIVVVGYFSAMEANTVKSKSQIADSLSLPSDFLSKILQKLVKANIVRSTRGAKGGYRLVKSPNEITLREVIEAIDGKTHLVDCLRKEFKDCGRSSFCTPIIRNMQQVEIEILGILDGVYFSQLKVNPAG